MKINLLSYYFVGFYITKKDKPNALISLGDFDYYTIAEQIIENYESKRKSEL